MSLDDDQWLTGLRQGDAASFERLVARFEGPLYRYFLASHGDPQLAGEQSADCFGDLVGALPKMKGDSTQLRPFVFAVARNVLRRAWRNRQPREAPLTVSDDLPSSSVAPDAAVEHREALDRVLRALDDLDLETREVFVLRYIEQMPLADVAALVGEPVGTVKSRVHRGRQRLEALLRTTDIR